MGTWPAPFRHLILIVTSALLAWGGTDLVPWVSDQAGYGILAASVLTAVLAYFTPLVQSYGVGSMPSRQLAARQGPR
jgi:hypothetical protein